MSDNKCFCHFNGLEVKDAKARKYSFASDKVKDYEVALRGSTGEMFSKPYDVNAFGESFVYRNSNGETRGKISDTSDKETLTNKEYVQTKIGSAVNEAKEYTNKAIENAVFGEVTIGNVEHAKTADKATFADEAEVCTDAVYANRAGTASKASDVVTNSNLDKALQAKANASDIPLICLRACEPRCYAKDLFNEDGSFNFTSPNFPGEPASFNLEYFNRRPVIGEQFRMDVITQSDKVYLSMTCEVVGFRTFNEVESAILKVIELVPAYGARDYVEGGSIDTALKEKASTSHTHDDRYYTENEIDTKLSGKSDTTHTHSEYASASHNHDTAYASKSHTHSEYASASHNHDTVYASKSHTHSDYASASHNHDNAYASKSHTHSDYASVNHSHSEYSAIDHNHDDVYVKKGEISSRKSVWSSEGGQTILPTSGNITITCSESVLDKIVEIDFSMSGGIGRRVMKIIKPTVLNNVYTGMFVYNSKLYFITLSTKRSTVNTNIIFSVNTMSIDNENNDLYGATLYNICIVEE